MTHLLTELAPGVSLLKERSERFKTSLFSVTLAVPLRKETATANALIPEVLYRGCSRCPDIESLAAETDRLYGAAVGVGVRRRGEMQCITLRCSVADERFVPGGERLLEGAIALLGELLLDPVLEKGRFRSDYVSGEGANLADAILSERSDKIAWANWRLLQEMCRGEAFSVHKLGDADEARNITAEQLWGRYQALLREAQVIFCYCGSAASQRVEHAVRTSFAWLISGRTPRFCCEVLCSPPGEVRRTTEHMDVTQGKLALGFRTGGVTERDGRYPAMALCNALYGGTVHSKLFCNVRERLGLCYYADSAYDRLKGILLVSTGVETGRIGRAEEEILAQLESVRRGDFTADEQAKAVRVLVNGLVASGDSQRQQEERAVTGLLTGRRYSGTEGLIRALEAVAPEEIAAAAGLVRLDTVYCLRGKEHG